MLYDHTESQLIIENPADSLHLLLGLMGSEVIDDETIDRLTDEVTLAEGEGTRDGWTNYDISMEFYPIHLSSESTQLVLSALGINEGDIPDAPTDV